MDVRPLQKPDLPALLELLEQADEDARLRTMAPEGREVEELELELAETSPFSELFPFVLEDDGVVRGYVCLCNYEGEAFLEGPLLAPGMTAQAARPLIREAVDLARLRGYGFVEAFVDEENKRAQEALQMGEFEPFRTTYIYELSREKRPPVKHPSAFRFVTSGEIEVSAYRDLYRDTSDNWATRLAWSDEELLERFAAPEVTLILAYEGTKLVGHLELELLPDENVAEVAYFGVLPEARGRGLGRELLIRGVHEAFHTFEVDLLLARAHDDERGACHILEDVAFRLSHGVVAFTRELSS